MFLGRINIFKLCQPRKIFAVGSREAGLALAYFSERAAIKEWYLAKIVNLSIAANKTRSEKRIAEIHVSF